MIKSFFVLMSLVMASNVFAETVKYPATFILNNWSTGKQQAIAECDMIQILKWEDRRLFAKCKFDGKNDVLSFAGQADKIGFNYDMNASFVVLGMNTDKGLGKFLLTNMAMPELSGKNQMNIYFGTKKPFSKDEAMFNGKMTNSMN